MADILRFTKIAALAGVVAMTSARAEPVCNTTTSNKCTSSGEACTKTVKTCTTFQPDGHTRIETTTSHDCGPGGPKDCPKSGSGSAAATRYQTVSTTQVSVKEPTGTTKPKLPVTRVPTSGTLQQATPTPTPKKAKGFSRDNQQRQRQ